MKTKFLKHVRSQVSEIRQAGLYKDEREIVSRQDAYVTLADGQRVLNLCSNNYLGYASRPEIIAGAGEYLDRFGFGLGSVRFICGTQSIHAELESRLAKFLRMEAAILYSSCFDANGGLFEPLLTADDAVISDSLNHASIIDGVRLCKARRYRYRNCDMDDLETQLKAASSARFRMIVTDGVFSMDGVIAPLREICDLADRHGALVMVDDSHATGFMGKEGRGTLEHCGVEGRVDLVTSTFGKALGGAGGGFTAGRRDIIELLRQKSRPYLFSNTLSPAVVGATLKALDLVESEPQPRQRLLALAAEFRRRMEASGFELTGGGHPIVPVLLGDAHLAQKMARGLYERGVYAVGFFYPVVPRGAARIRTQLSALHSDEDILKAVAAFVDARR